MKILWNFIIFNLILITTFGSNAVHSDSPNSTVNTSNTSCVDEVLVNAFGNGSIAHISSPEFPRGYPKAQSNCSRIRYQLVNVWGGFVRLVFDDFILDSGGDDYVQIGSNIYKETDRPYAEVVNGSLEVLFFFDEIDGDGLGWKATAEFVREPEWEEMPSNYGIESSAVFKENSLGGDFRVKSIGERVYLDVTWVIRVPKNQSILFNVLEWELNGGESRFKIHYGPTSESPWNGFANGFLSFATIDSSSNIYVRLKSWLAEDGDIFHCSYAAYEEAENCSSINSFECDMDIELPICIDPSLVCDGVSNCYGTKYTTASDEICPTEDPNACLCQNGGECNPDYENSTILCYCPADYRGLLCEQYDPNCPPCANGGRCVILQLWPSPKYGCVCTPGYDSDTYCLRKKGQWSIILVVSVTLLCFLFLVLMCVCVVSIATRKSSYRTSQSLRRSRRIREEHLNLGYAPERTPDMPPAYDEYMGEGNEDDAVDGGDDDAGDTNSYIRPPPSPSPSMDVFFPDAPPPPYCSREDIAVTFDIESTICGQVRTPNHSSRPEGTAAIRTPNDPSPRDRATPEPDGEGPNRQSDVVSEERGGITTNHGPDGLAEAAVSCTRMPPVEEEALTAAPQESRADTVNSVETLRSDYRLESDEFSKAEIKSTPTSNDKQNFNSQNGSKMAKEETLV